MSKKGEAFEIVGTLFLISIGVLIFAFLFGFAIIDYNEYAVVKSLSGHLSNELRDQGFIYKGLFASAIRVNNQHRNHEVQIDAVSKDLQNVFIQLNINMQIKKDEVYNFVLNYPDEKIYTQYLNNKIQERIKIVVLKYGAEEFIYNRGNISREILSEVRNIPDINYFQISDIAIKNIEYSPEFTAILEKKAQIDIEQQIILKQKENVRLINDNIKLINMDDYFRYELINKWDGKSTIPVILDLSVRNVTN